MTESILLQVRLRAFTKRQSRKWFAACPSLNVNSQGTNQEDARRSLQEAVELWFESCIERGTLEKAIQEVGFVPVPWGARADDEEELARVIETAEDQDLLGRPFELAVEIPAYRAAAILRTQARA